ncbi:MAG: SDR family oxidoreductase [Verrucomicrobia bacterium]|nr:SDR family oxidoreductase [Verrucomicrobiota bacterium]MDE3100321.1 SDR family oxidoreductase [Verrucomicrobiota bacterium]
METVLITGASSGIGLELAKCFAADGSRLVLVARNATALQALADELRRQNGVQVIVLPSDLAQPQTPVNLFQQLSDQRVTVDVLVNNAGFGAFGLFHDLPSARQLGMIQVNIRALVELTRLFLPEMLRRRTGGVLNVASVAAFVPGPGMAVYYATKAFVLSFTEALAVELAGSGLKTVALCPGPTPTNFGAVAGMDAAHLVRVPPTSAQKVAQDGHRAWRAASTVCVSGIQNKLLVALIRLAPRTVVRRMVGKFNGFADFKKTTN